MKKEGKIVKIEEEDAIIEMLPQEGCSKCSLCKGLDVQRVTVNSVKVKGLSAGNRVEIEISESSMMRAYMLLYALPLIVFVGGIFAFYAAFHSPIVSLMGALLVTVLTYILIGSYIKKNLTLFSDIYIKAIGK